MVVELSLYVKQNSKYEQPLYNIYIIRTHYICIHKNDNKNNFLSDLVLLSLE